MPKQRSKMRLLVRRLWWWVRELTWPIHGRPVGAYPQSASIEEADELADFDPTQEQGGGPCERCGYRMDPWVYSRLCQGCVWDDAGAK